MNGIEFRKLKTGDTIKIEKGPDKGKIFVLKEDQWFTMFMMTFFSQLLWSIIYIEGEPYSAEDCSIIRKGV